ncbi:MAG TPA: hypothetical protein VGU20_01715 [Stellaceae bacterium]|nr:hypothetical protein [Stellaceae bacterium]
MTYSIDVLITWRNEVAAELTTAEKEFSSAAERLAAAEANIDVHRQSYRSIEEAVRPLRSRSAVLATAVTLRLVGKKKDLDRGLGEVTQARGCLESAKRRVDDLRLALEQLVEIIPADALGPSDAVKDVAA